MLSVVCSASDGNIFDGLYMTPHTLLLRPPVSPPPLFLQVSQILIRLMDALSTPSEMVQKTVSSTITGLMKGAKARGEEGTIMAQVKKCNRLIRVIGFQRESVDCGCGCCYCCYM